jgi:hypothetical protein
MANAFQYTLFYYPPYAYYDPSYYRYLSYRDAIAIRKITGINLNTYYPINRYYRTQASLSFYRYEEDFFDPFLRQSLSFSGTGYSSFWNGNWILASFSIIGETTRFKFYGPASGETFALTLSQALPISNSFFQNTNFYADLRKYLYIGSDILLAVRFEGFFSRGRDPYIYYYGGNNQVRSVNYANIIANEGWFANAELRFPLVNAASTLIGQIGPVRGVIFLDMTRSKLKGFPAHFYTWDGEKVRTTDAIGSFGYGLEFFFLGIPLHLEFVKRVEIPDMSSPFDYETIGDFRTEFWIGFDF